MVGAAVTAAAELRCCDVAALLADESVPRARLVHADPPWSYDNDGPRGAAAGHYATTDARAIAVRLDEAIDRTDADAYLLLWATSPLLGDVFAEMARSRWSYVTALAWHKTPGIGVGYHARGDHEHLLLWRRGKPKPVQVPRSLWSGPRAGHSVKPEAWLRHLLLAYTRPGDLVLDLYAGTAPMAIASLRTGRRYVGAEIDPATCEAARASIEALGGAVTVEGPCST